MANGISTKLWKWGFSIVNGTVITIRGHNSDADALAGIVGVNSSDADAYFPAAAIAAADIDIVSSDADDDEGGAGAHKITIVGLGTNYRLQTEEVELNGIADVHPTKNYLRMFEAYVSDGFVNQGNITIDDDAGNTFLTIATGEACALSAQYTVPANYSVAYLTSFDGALASATHYGTLKLWVKGDQDVAWYPLWSSGINASVPVGRDFLNPVAIQPKTDIKVEISNADADNLDIYAGFQLLLK